MATDRQDLRNQCRYTFRFLSSCASYQAQGILGGRLLQELHEFVHGPESGSTDCGSVDITLLAWSKEVDTHYFQDVPQNINVEALLPFDYKMMLPHLDKRYKGGQYHHQISITVTQASHVAAFIVVSPLSPSWVALIPRWYLDPESRKNIVDTPAFYGPEIPLSSGGTEPFPPNWTPLIMPLPYLGSAIRAFAEFAHGRAEFFQNPYTNFKSTRLRRPSLRPLRYLMPSPDSPIQDFPFVQRLWSILKHNSTKYHIKRVITQPSVADLFLNHVQTGELIAAEVKLSAVQMKSDGSMQISLISSLTQNSVWDVLVMTMSSAPSDPHYGLPESDFWIFPRGDLPQPLWHPDKRVRGEFNTKTFNWVEPHAGFFRDHHVRWSSDIRIARQVEDILDQLRSSGKSRATGEVNFTLEALALPQKRQATMIDPPQRGSHDKWAAKLWRAEQHDRFQILCTRERAGRIFDLPKNPSAHFAFSPFCGPETTFCELSPLAITVYLNIATIAVNDELFANDCRRPTQFRHVVEGTSQKVYVVPSPLLATEHWRTYNNQLRTTGLKTQARNPTEISLTNGSTLERYRTHFSRLGEVLERFAKRDFSPDPTRPHNITVLMHALQTYASIRQTKQFVVQEYAHKLEDHGLVSDSDAESD